MKTLARFILLLFVCAAIVLGVAYHSAVTSYGPSTETFVTIAPGTGTPAIAAQLEQSGIIRTRYLFDAIRLIQRGRLQAGEYRFDHPATPIEVYARLVRGDVYTQALTIPEGYNIFDIAAAVQAAGLGSAQSFLAAEQHHTELIAQWSPHSASLEGYLFPDTYRFPAGVTPLQILQTMVRRFHQEATRLGITDVNRTVILASLVEKEVAANEERPLVAGVFVNRLAKGMPLATDPTVIYAALLNNRWRGTIYESDLQSDSPYNTYKHTGLPPGPICNPGLAALKAAIAPAQTTYLFFVSDAQGHSRFASSMAEHAHNVVQYRKAQHATGHP